MRSSIFIILLALMVWKTSGAHGAVPTRNSQDPDRLQVCVVSDISNGTRGVSRGSGYRELPRERCPLVKPSDCKSQQLIRCGHCMTCLVYLGKGDVCKLPYETNARCSPDLVCYTKGTCGDLVR